MLAMAKIDGSAISRLASILRAAFGRKGECRVFYKGEPLNKQGIPKKICAAKIFWEEEQQVYISKRRIAARKNYLVATSAERKQAASGKAGVPAGFL